MGEVKMIQHLIRWRLNSPDVDNRSRWTKVHTISSHAEDLTVCRLPIFPDRYMTDVDDQIPADAPRCQRCAQIGQD